MRTAVVILNWNTRDYLGRFLPPLLASLRGLDAGVVVADNASTDGSRALLAERFPQVRTLLFEENFGFTGGYNRAFERCWASRTPRSTSSCSTPTSRWRTAGCSR